MASKAGTPYNRPQPIRLRCVGERTSVRSLTFKTVDNVIKSDQTRITTLVALSNGKMTYICPQNGDHANFVEDSTYIIKNYTINNKYGKDCIMIDHKTSIYKTSPLPLTQLEKETALELLLPSSKNKTGEEHDLFTGGGYVTLVGHVNNLKVIRMTTSEPSQIPVLDLDLSCGTKTLNITLWRDEALIPLHIEDKIILTHLRPSSSNNQRKLNSSAYTTVTVIEQKPQVEEIEVIGISEHHDGLALLTSDYNEYILSPDVHEMRLEDVLPKLPLKINVEVFKGKITQFSHVE